MTQRLTNSPLDKFVLNRLLTAFFYLSKLDSYTLGFCLWVLCSSFLHSNNHISPFFQGGFKCQNIHQLWFQSMIWKVAGWLPAKFKVGEVCLLLLFSLNAFTAFPSKRNPSTLHILSPIKSICFPLAIFLVMSVIHSGNCSGILR